MEEAREHLKDAIELVLKGMQERADGDPSCSQEESCLGS
ncbi:MAG: hypothetical protein M3317_06995 [Actinomycetota bacterium]|nr:hypothetical protein [Actinomycetota bacterium]